MLPFAALLLMLAQPAAATAQPLSRADREQVITNAARLLETRYVDPERGRSLAGALRRQAPAWQGIGDRAAFAAAVSDWLRRESGDGHLALSHSATPIPDQPDGEAAFNAEEMERWYGAHLNHGVQRIERLDGNIMLLELSVFPPPAMGGDVIAAAMNVVAQGDALILDLRRNGGGAETASLVVGYLLDRMKPLSGSYDRPSGASQANTSPDWVPGRRFGGSKPLYILTSRRTFSAAEAVAYDLQALRRAIIVGERTGGGAHPYAYRRVHAHFALDLPEGRSVNPITGGNWQNVGVRPDVEVPADKALDRALELARAAIRDRSAGASGLPALP
jgi:hypothetical protein